MKFIVAIIYLVEFDSTEPDRYSPVITYDTITECKAMAKQVDREVSQMLVEAIVVCLREGNTP